MSPDAPPGKHPELELLLRTRAALLKPDPQIITKALRLCAKHDPVTSRFTASGRLNAEGMLDLEDQNLPDLPAESDDGSIASAPTVVSEHQGFPPEAVAAVGPTLPNRDPPATGGRADLRGLGPGHHIAGYRIEGLLGKGGMGHVYRATQLSMNREVALKVLSPRLGNKKTFRDRFIREARNAGSFQHPNLIGVHDVGESEGLLFFSMELVDGISVKKLIKRDGRIDETRAYMICHQTLQALQYAHEQGIIHRDIKPDNLMLTKAGTVKVADLGLSRINDGREGGPSSATRTGSMMGTPYYMPPEQGRDASRADHRSDLYALGATLFHMVCGQVPFNGNSPMEVLMRAATNDLVFPDPAPSAGMQTLIRTLMAKDPAGRPSSAAEAIHLVEKLSGLSSTQMGLATRTTVDRRRAHQRRRSLGFAIPAVVLGLLVAVAIGVWRHYQGPGRIRAAWTELRRDVGNDVIHRRFVEAIERMDAFAKIHPEPGAEIGAQLATLREDANKQWDVWCQGNEDIQDALFNLKSEVGELKDGTGDARKVDGMLLDLKAREAWLSPWLQTELEAIEARLEELRRPLAAVRDWLGGAQFTPPATVTLDGTGPVILPRTARGGGPLAMQQVHLLTLNRQPALPQRFKLTVAVTLERPDSLHLVVGDHERGSMHRVDINAGYLVLRTADPDRTRFGGWRPGGRRGGPDPRRDRDEGPPDAGEELLRVPHDGTAVLHLAWDGRRLELGIENREGKIVKAVPMPHDIHQATPVVIVWRSQRDLKLDIRPSL